MTNPLRKGHADNCPAFTSLVHDDTCTCQSLAEQFRELRSTPIEQQHPYKTANWVVRNSDEIERALEWYDCRETGPTYAEQRDRIAALEAELQDYREESDELTRDDIEQCKRIAALEAENVLLKQYNDALATGSEYTDMKYRLQRLIDGTKERDDRIAELEEQLRIAIAAKVE